MKEKPILFNSEMVRAILDGRKTQTRRPIKVQPNPKLVAGAELVDRFWCWLSGHDGSIAGKILKTGHCPFGQPGDQLWVRETFYCDMPEGEPIEERRKELCYRVDVPSGRFQDAGYWSETGSYWRPSIHMPRWASRITLEVTGVRVERVKEISEADARAEGVEESSAWFKDGHRNTYIPSFHRLWEQTYPGSWERNDWVWVVEFKVLTADTKHKGREE